MKQGLTTNQAKEALKKYGLNQLPEKKTTSALEVLVRQVKNPFSFLLLSGISWIAF